MTEARMLHQQIWEADGDRGFPSTIKYRWQYVHIQLGMDSFHFFKKRSLRFKNEEEKTKTFLKTIVLESNPSLTITSELLKRKYIFCL